MIQSRARMTTCVQGINSQDFSRHTHTNLSKAGQRHVDLGSAPVSTHNLSASAAGRTLSAMATAKHDVPATVTTTTQQEGQNIKSLFLLQELAKAEEHVEKLKGYWAAVAEDLGPTMWADPMNPYRRVWEQEISSACDKLEYLEQSAPSARVPGSKTQLPHDFKARGINKVNNRERNTKCDHAGPMCEKHASHMRTLKRKATRQRKRAREQMALWAHSHNFQHSGDLVSASDGSPRLAQRTRIETNQSWNWNSRQDHAPVVEHPMMKDAGAQASACHWHQTGTSPRLSETNQTPTREESVEAIQDRILATLEKELTLPKEIPFLEALVPSPQVEKAETEDRDCKPKYPSMVPSNLENGGCISRTESIQNVQGRILSALELTLPIGLTSPKARFHEPKAARTVYVGGVPSLDIGDLQMLFHAYEMYVYGTIQPLGGAYFCRDHSASISFPSGHCPYQPSSFGYVTLWNSDVARDAARELSGREVRGRQVFVCLISGFLETMVDI